MYFLEEVFHANMESGLFKTYEPHEVKDKTALTGPGFLDNLDRGLKKIAR